MADPSSPTGVTSLVVVTDDQNVVDVDIERWRQLATSVVNALGAHGELSLTFVDPDTIAELKGEFLGELAPTDVLAFPMDGGQQGSSDVPMVLGDVVICPEVAVAQCPEHAGTPDDEIALLVVHGILHLVGHDHADAEETMVMRALERQLLETHHWMGPAPTTFRQEQE